MWSPVMSFCRIDDKPIRTREPVTEPDALIIQDPTLLHQADPFAGLSPNGYMLVNSTRDFGELGLDEFVQGFHRDRLLVVPASSLAMTHLGRPLPGAALLGGFAALTWAVSLPGQRDRQARHRGVPVRDRLRLLQGLRPVRRLMPLRRHRDGTRTIL